MKVHIGPYRKNRREDIRIDAYDTWSMDCTLALIVLPMLKQLKETKHGSPYVDNIDVPEALTWYDYDYRQGDLFLTHDEQQSLSDEYIHAKWDWVMDEMIWAFEQKCRDHWEEDYYGPYIRSEDDELFGGHFEWVDDEGRIAHQARMSNGFRLFGKYYEGLWD
jgi:hypothetical protein